MSGRSSQLIGRDTVLTKTEKLKGNLGEMNPQKGKGKHS